MIKIGAGSAAPQQRFFFEHGVICHMIDTQHDGGDDMSLSRSLHTILIGAAFAFIAFMLFV
ncbi:hypothetical protein EDC90_10172 [Martelella mediterranea]|uniref:Uncharacterized protein n=1 Tax=Martelella mediterranea TaxID=293089 RepID=A0A4R3NNX7_9HYPH|nr:hypothetical protein EDC90_10172 [Martelella mediterranea]